MKRKFAAAVIFCGADGATTGATEALEVLGFDVDLTAINHWPVAIATHTTNHPKARHLCTGLDSVNPRDLYKPGQLKLFLASPECTHHSIDRGVKPIKAPSRATAWCVIRWAEALIEFNGLQSIVDFEFRMLQPHELAAAQSFRKDYIFTGNKTQQVAQIGNAVPRRTARAHVLAAVSQNADISRYLDLLEPLESKVA